MEHYLFTITHTFVISGRGIVVGPGIRVGERLGAGEVIELRRPDGMVLHCVVRGIEMPTYLPTVPKDERRAGILLGVSQDDVSIGTEVWKPGTVVQAPAVAEHGIRVCENSRSEVYVV